MDDDIGQRWSIDAAHANELRLKHVHRLVERQDWPQAVLEAEELLDVAPDHVETLSLLARAQLGMADAEGAVQTWEQVLALDPSAHGDRLANLAMARLDCCDLLGAASAAREALRLDPSLAEAHFVLGVALEHQADRTSEAAQALSAANRLDPLAFPFPLQLDPAGWEQALTTAMIHVAPPVRALWEGVTVRLPELPDLADLRRHAPPLSPRIPGMLVGEPPETGDPWQTRPEALLLYARNLARARDLEELVERIAFVLEQEALVWAGEDPWNHHEEPDLDT